MHGPSNPPTSAMDGPFSCSGIGWYFGIEPVAEDGILGWSQFLRMVFWDGVSQGCWHFRMEPVAEDAILGYSQLWRIVSWDGGTNKIWTPLTAM